MHCNNIHIYHIPILVLVSSGLVGNVFCLIVLRLKYPRTATSFLLSAICTADTIMLGSTFMEELLFWFGQRGSLTKIVLTISKFFISDVAQLISIWLIVVLGFARYMAVAKPLHVSQYCSLSRIKLAAIVITTVAIAIEIIRVIPYAMRCESVTSNSSNVSSSVIYRCRYLPGYTEYLYYCGAMFIFPMLPIMYFCIGLIRALHQKNTIKMDTRNSRMRNEANDITRTVVAIIVVFFLSYSMYLVWFLAYEMPIFNNFMNQHQCSGRILEAGMNFAFNLNSSLNFVIYLICTRSFRENFKELFRRESPTVNTSLTII